MATLIFVYDVIFSILMDIFPPESLALTHFSIVTETDRVN